MTSGMTSGVDGTVLAADPITGLANMLTHPFIQHGVIAGTAIALLCGLVGYFVVLRSQVFAGDALSHVSYTGALAALAAGVDLRFGLFAATIVTGIVLGILGGRAGADDTVIGVGFAWILGLGVFFLAYYTTHNSTGNGAAGTRVLFGSIFGINRDAAWLAVGVAVVVIAVLLLIARPLLFASLDPAVAGARGVPVRVLGAVFLGLVGAAAAEATQVVGALLLFGLLAAPPAAAQRLTSTPWRGFWLSAVFAVAAMWLGLVLAYAFPRLPASFTITAVAAAQFAVAGLITSVRDRQAGRTVPQPAGSTPAHVLSPSATVDR